MNIDDKERRVLSILQSVGEDYSLNFNGIVSRYRKQFPDTGDFTRGTARRLCRSLRDKGLAFYRNGLFDESTGLTAGSGYSVSAEGMKFDVEKPKAS
jgi:hypothetical protein